MLRSTPPANKLPAVPTRNSVLQPLQRTTQPTRVLQPSREPLQLSFQFHR
jgi:hypothetical protein